MIYVECHFSLIIDNTKYTINNTTRYNYNNNPKKYKKFLLPSVNVFIGLETYYSVKKEYDLIWPNKPY